MSEAWIITSGEYDDYRVHYACPDEATALACVARLNSATDGGYETERLPLVNDPTELLTVKEYRYHYDGTPVMATDGTQFEADHAPGIPGVQYGSSQFFAVLAADVAQADFIAAGHLTKRPDD